MLEIEAERAKQRQQIAGETFGRGKNDSLVSNETILSQGKAMDFAAHKVGLSPTTYYRAKTILEKASPEVSIGV